MKERIINYAIRFYKWIQSNAVFANVCIWGSNLAIDIFTFLLRKKGCLSVIILCIQILGIAFTFWLYKIGKKRQCLDNAKWDKNEEVHRALYDSIDDLTEKEQRQAQINKRTLSDHNRLAEKEAEDDVKHGLEESRIESESKERDEQLVKRIEGIVAPEPEIDIFFSNNQKEVTVNPVYKRITYQQRPVSRYSPSPLEIINNPLQALMNQYKYGKQQQDKLTVRAINKEIYKSYCPISFIVKNTGICEISDFRIIVEWDVLDGPFLRTNENDIPFIHVLDPNIIDVRFRNDEKNVIIEPLRSIAPKDRYSSNLVYFRVPIGTNDVHLHWTMYKASEPQSGDLIIHIDPNYFEQVVETSDTNLIGTNRVEFYTESIS